MGGGGRGRNSVLRRMEQYLYSQVFSQVGQVNYQRDVYDDIVRGWRERFAVVEDRTTPAHLRVSQAMFDESACGYSSNSVGPN